MNLISEFRALIRSFLTLVTICDDEIRLLSLILFCRLSYELHETKPNFVWFAPLASGIIPGMSLEFDK